MSYEVGRIEPKFVLPGDAGPAGLRSVAHEMGRPPGPSAAFADERHKRARLAAAARRRSRLRHIIPLTLAGIAAVAFIAMTNGGQKAREAAPMQAYVGGFLERLGFGLTEVAVKGQRMTSDREIYDRLQLSERRSVWLLDTEAARRRIEALPWVFSASLRRSFPDRLLVEIQERRPRARWRTGHRTMLIDATGRVLGPGGASEFDHLPDIYGEGAADHGELILTAVSQVPQLQKRIALYEWSANRRWTLHLKSGRRILLPTFGMSLALIQVTKGAPGETLLDTDFEVLDLRIANQVAVELRHS